MKKTIKLTTPLTEEKVRGLKMGDEVLITGSILTGRDAAHKRLTETLTREGKLPVNLEGEIIYYVGPSPAKPGQAIGSAGPTTSYRMDAYSPTLIRETGLRGMIGKGPRNAEVIKAMREKGAVYFVSIGGAAALIAKAIKKAEVLLYPELGPEAVQRLQVIDFPAIVATDAEGRSLYDEGPKSYKRS